jgi:hypothetical protein
VPLSKINSFSNRDLSPDDAFSTAGASSNIEAQLLARATKDSPIFTGDVWLPSASTMLTSPVERITLTNIPSANNMDLDALTQSILYSTINATATWRLNIRGDISTPFRDIVAVGQSLTIVYMSTNGSTAYSQDFQNGFRIDGVLQTPKWQGGSRPTAGNANSIDIYSYTIIKTSNTPTYLTLASMVGFS